MPNLTAEQMYEAMITKVKVSNPELLPMLIPFIQDALRYRKLRMCHWNTSPMAVVMNPKEAVRLGHRCPSGPLLDMEIDQHL